jgi:predicted metal-dependent hydrolase
MRMKQYPQAYLNYLAYFHGSRDYFECHEVLEEYWKDNLDSPFKHIWVGLIQVAVANYHQRRGNHKGAIKMLTSAIHLLSNDDVAKLGIDHPTFMNVLQQRFVTLTNQPDAPYTAFDIPLTDLELQRRVEAMINAADATYARGNEWDPLIMNKHTLRDRTEVIANRQAEWNRRKSQLK